MMKNLILIISLLLSTKDFGQTSKGPTIYPGKGLGDIVIDNSTLDSVIKTFGKNKIKERSVKGCGTFGDADCGKEKYVFYKDKGVSFNSWPKSTDKIVRLIVLESSCEFKTDKGIGIGSSKADIIAKYGQPVSEQKQDTDYRLEYNGVTYFVSFPEREPFKNRNRQAAIAARQY